MIDFTPLTDDQLVELVRAACAECGVRGMAVQEAARAAMLSEHEKAQIAAIAASREAERLRQREAEKIAREAAQAVRREAEALEGAEAAEKQRRTEARCKKIALMVEAILGRGWKLTVWTKNGETRVYFDRGTAKYTWYKTGNSYNPAGKLAWDSGSTPAPTPELSELIIDCAKTAAGMYTQVSIECNTYSDCLTEAAPMKEGSTYFARVEAMRFAEAAANAEREAAERDEIRQQYGGDVVGLGGCGSHYFLVVRNIEDPSLARIERAGMSSVGWRYPIKRELEDGCEVIPPLVSEIPSADEAGIKYSRNHWPAEGIAIADLPTIRKAVLR